MNFLTGLSSAVHLAAAAPDRMANFYQSLEIMGFGMAGIFIVLGMLFASVKILIKLFPEKE